jgi:hypothetical protein
MNTVPWWMVWVVLSALGVVFATMLVVKRLESNRPSPHTHPGGTPPEGMPGQDRVRVGSVEPDRGRTVY